MYVPVKFATALDAAWRVVTDAGAANLVVATPEGLRSVFVPFVVGADRTTLTSHVARANPWWRGLDGDLEVLALFVAASAYVSPTYYPSRLVNPSVVPTWNYVAAEVRGRLRIHDDHAWLADQVRRQTAHYESANPEPWRVEDAPADFIDHQLRAIVGVEIEVLSIEGKAKLSQNRPPEDRVSVREHLDGLGPAAHSVARRMTGDDEHAVHVVRTDESRWRDLHDIRIEALADTPDAYGSILADAAAAPEHYWRAMAARGHTFLAEFDGRVIGVATGGTNDDVPDTAWLYGMYVTPAHRGTGAAQRLVDAIVSWARAEGYDRLHLKVANTVGRARAFYERAGFVADGPMSTMERDSSITLTTLVRDLD